MNKNYQYFLCQSAFRQMFAKQEEFLTPEGFKAYMENMGYLIADELFESNDNYWVDWTIMTKLDVNKSAYDLRRFNVNWDVKLYETQREKELKLEEANEL